MVYIGYESDAREWAESIRAWLLSSGIQACLITEIADDTGRHGLANARLFIFVISPQALAGAHFPPEEIRPPGCSTPIWGAQITKEAISDDLGKPLGLGQIFDLHTDPSGGLQNLVESASAFLSSSTISSPVCDGNNPATTHPTSREQRISAIDPRGVEKSYLIPTGEHKIGSDTSCQIRIEGDGVLPLHGILFVSEEGVSIANLGKADTMTINGVPVEGREPISIGQELRVGEISLKLRTTDIGREHPDYDTPDGTVVLRKGEWKKYLDWLGGHSILIEKIAEELSPEEAKAAEDHFSAGKKRFSAVLFALLALLVANLFFVPLEWFSVREIVDEAMSALALLGSAWLVSRHNVRYAGRLLLTLLLLGDMGSEGITSSAERWDDVSNVWLVGLLLAISFFFGWGIDYGSSTLPERTKSLWRKIILSIIGCFWGSLAFWAYDSAEGTKPVFPFLSGLSSIGLILWGWVAVPRIERKAHELQGDVLTCTLFAWQRYKKFFLGRTMAVALGLLPLFLFLNLFGIQEKFDRALKDDGQTLFQTTSKEEEKTYWFWQDRGVFLKKDAVATAQFYGAETGEFPEITTLVEKVSENAKDRESFEKLEQLLTPYRLDGEKLASYLLSDPEIRKGWYVECNRSAKTRMHPEGELFYYARPLLSLQGMGISEINHLATLAGTYIYYVAVFGLVGFLFLWRRGGDSPLAFWIGTWTIFAAGGPAWLSFSGCIMDAFKYTMWHVGMSSPSAAIYFLAINLMEVITLIGIYMNLATIPLMAAFVHLCWPPNFLDIKRRGNEKLKLWGKIVLMALGLNGFAGIGSEFIDQLLSVALPDMPSADSGSIAFALVIVLNCSVLSPLGYWLRIKYRQRSECPGNGHWLFVSFAWSQITAICLIIQGTHSFFPSWPTNWSSIAFGVIVLLLILRKNFLRLRAERDLSFVIVAVIAPFCFEFSENLVQDILKQTSFFSEKGANILGLCVVVLVLTPFWDYLKKVMARMTIPQFPTIQKTISGAMFDILEGEKKTDVREKVRRLFEDLSVGHFLFYEKGAEGYFDEVVSRTDHAAVDRLFLSPSLRSTLVQENSFIDMDNAMYEWRFFFVQFELYRVKRATGCRYLLPISCGESIRALIFLPDNGRSSELSRFAIANDFVNMGLSVCLKKEDRKLAKDKLPKAYPV
jgi:hypothetical protein